MKRKKTLSSRYSGFTPLVCSFSGPRLKTGLRAEGVRANVRPRLGLDLIIFAGGKVQNDE